VRVVASELEERARLLKQRLNIKTSTSASAAAAADGGGGGGVPFSDSEVSGPHRSRPARDGGRKSAGGAATESPGRGSWGGRGVQSAGDRGGTAAAAAAGGGGGAGRHAGHRSSSSSSQRHADYPARRSHTADVHADRTYRRRGMRAPRPRRFSHPSYQTTTLLYANKQREK